MLIAGLAVGHPVRGANDPGIHGGTPLTMEGPPIPSGTLVITGTHIEAVGGSEEVEIPADAEVIDFAGPRSCRA